MTTSPERIVRRTPSIVVLFVFSMLVVMDQSYSRDDLRFNPVIRAIEADPSTKKWGLRTSLIPVLFETGMSAEAVNEVMHLAGFDPTPKGALWTRYDSEIEQGRLAYTREANTFICNVTVYVFVEFDRDDGLICAEGLQHEHGCL